MRMKDRQESKTRISLKKTKKRKCGFKEGKKNKVKGRGKAGRQRKSVSWKMGGKEKERK